MIITKIESERGSLIRGLRGMYGFYYIITIQISAKSEDQKCCQFLSDMKSGSLSEVGTNAGILAGTLLSCPVWVGVGVRGVWKGGRE